MVVIQKPGDDTTFRSPEVTLEYNIFSPTGQEITKRRLPVQQCRARRPFRRPPPTGKCSPRRVELPLPPEDVTITLVAHEDARASEPATVRLRWDGPKPGQLALRRLRALFVGVNSYTSPKLATQLRTKGCEDLAAVRVAGRQELQQG